jgi:hypothetical protein
MYDTQAFASSRLLETVIFYKGSPYYVSNIGPDLTISALALPDLKTSSKIPMKDPDLNVSKFQLGYMNQASRGGRPVTGYFSRMPVRKTKQGLSYENTSFIPLSGDRRPTTKFPYSWGEFIGTQGFVDGLSGRFPSKEEALAGIALGKYIGQAFSRSFAFEMSSLGLIFLHYKGNPIAYSEDGDLFRAKKRYHYLREVMLDAGLQLSLKEA